MELITPFELWLWTRCDSILGLFGGALGIIGTTIIILAIVGGVVGSCYPSEKEKRFAASCLWHIRWMVVLCAVSAIVVTVVPSTKDAALIFGVPAIVNNETLQQDAGDLYRIGMDRAKELLEVEEDQQ